MTIHAILNTLSKRPAFDITKLEFGFSPFPDPEFKNIPVEKIKETSRDNFILYRSYDEQFVLPYKSDDDSYLTVGANILLTEVLYIVFNNYFRIYVDDWKTKNTSERNKIIYDVTDDFIDYIITKTKSCLEKKHEYKSFSECYDNYYSQNYKEENFSYVMLYSLESEMRPVFSLPIYLEILYDGEYIDKDILTFFYYDTKNN